MNIDSFEMLILFTVLSLSVLLKAAIDLQPFKVVGGRKIANKIETRLTFLP